MPRFAANLTMLFTEQLFVDRFSATGQAGFRAVEFLFPYKFQADDLAIGMPESEAVLHCLGANRSFRGFGMGS